MSGLKRHLKMDEAAGETVLDAPELRVLGKPLDRYEGPLKVTGTAPYAYDWRVGENAVYGVLVTSTIAAGRLISVDATAALAVAGVLLVIDDNNKMPVAAAQPHDQAPELGSWTIVHYGQPVALVVAETFELATDAAQLVKVNYKPAERLRLNLGQQASIATLPKSSQIPADTLKGDFEAAFDAADMTLDATYTTPSQNSAAMEPHASLAVWNDDELTLYGAYQLLDANRGQLARSLGISKSKVRIVSNYVGGGFGSKLGLAPEAVLASLAAKELKRPVKVALARQQVFDVTVRRTNTIQRIRLAGGKDGKLTGIAHETLVGNSPGQGYWEPAGIATTFLYAAEHRKITHRLGEVNILLSASMRGPGEAVGMLALECAMDEMAEALDLDPIAFRKLNEPTEDPIKSVPFSTRKLIECYDEGAKRFGWDKRSKRPGAHVDGEWLIGMGMATAARGNLLQPSQAKVTVTSTGRIVVETDMTDIGTGSYSILAQIAAEMFGLTIDNVDVKIGDTRYPPSAGSGGSWGAASSGSSVYLACEEIREKLARNLGVDAKDALFRDGYIVANNTRTLLGEAAGNAAISAIGSIAPGSTQKTSTQASYGAHFAEVAVSRNTGETRVRRMLGVFASGRILNLKTARSQCSGGMIFGIGAALTEDLVTDERYGNFVNHDLAEYHVPTNADVPQIEVVFLEERDNMANPLKAKGIGELGISGAGASIGNAIYNATGVRVRDFPITLDKILRGLA